MTISNWRRKLVWLMAGILVLGVLIGQLIWNNMDNVANNTVPLNEQEQATISTQAENSSVFSGLLEKLREFYQGK